MEHDWKSRCGKDFSVYRSCVMAESLFQQAAKSTEKAGNCSQSDTKSDAIHCIVARAIWPHKTGANWAAASGVQERMVKYWLAGSHPVSAAGKLAIIRLLDD
jgi:hypothetical protein